MSDDEGDEKILAEYVLNDVSRRIDAAEVTANQMQPYLDVLRSVIARAQAQLESIDDDRKAAIESLHRFVSTVEQATPALGDPSWRKSIIEAAFKLADELSATPTGVLHAVTRRASGALGPQLDRPEDPPADTK